MNRLKTGPEMLGSPLKRLNSDIGLSQSCCHTTNCQSAAANVLNGLRLPKGRLFYDANVKDDTDHIFVYCDPDPLPSR